MIRSPVVRLALGLVSMMTCVFILADMAFGLMADEAAHANATRSVLVHIATEQIAERLNAQDRRGIETTLETLRRHYPELQAAGVRELAGGLVASSGSLPSADAVRPAGLDHVKVPIHSAQGQWGYAEFVFPSTSPGTVGAWLTQRRVWLPVSLVIAMVLCAALYLRRALTYLDPMSVIPERVRTAFDSLHEGVALLDRAGRVVLANRALRAMARADEGRMHGRPLTDGAHLRLPVGFTTPPWQAAMESARPVLGTRITVGAADSGKAGSMDCSPIIDTSGKVRGCMVTVADLTDIEKTNDQLRCSLAELERSQATVEAQNKELIRLALHDGLTSLLNRRSFFETAEAVVSRCRRSGSPVAVLMLDVDHFKGFNDRHGHAIGDLVLQRVAQCLHDSLRAGDLCGRYGGEEFCALMEGQSPDEALLIAERIRANIQSHAGLGLHDGVELSVTVSIGLCTAPPTVMDLASMLKQADEALYVAKRGGRNRVDVISRSPLEPVAGAARIPA